MKKLSRQRNSTKVEPKLIGKAHEDQWDPSFEIDAETEKLVGEMMDATGQTFRQIVTNALAAYLKAHKLPQGV
jgi:hypothetical protein